METRTVSTSLLEQIKGSAQRDEFITLWTNVLKGGGRLKLVEREAGVPDKEIDMIDSVPKMEAMLSKYNVRGM